MKILKLEAKKRTLLGKSVKKLRSAGMIVGVVYGKKIESVSLEIPAVEFAKVFAKAGETGLIELSFDGHTEHVLIKNVQVSPAKRSVLHVEFHAVNLKEKIKANIPVVLVGESVAVQNGVGLVLKVVDEIEVEALPANLLENFEIDITNLSEVDQQVTVGDIKKFEGIEVLSDPETVIVKVVPAIVEEVVEAVETPTEGGEGETSKEEESTGEVDKTESEKGE